METFHRTFPYMCDYSMLENSIYISSVFNSFPRQFLSFSKFETRALRQTLVAGDGPNPRAHFPRSRQPMYVPLSPTRPARLYSLHSHRWSRCRICLCGRGLIGYRPLCRVSTVPGIVGRFRTVEWYVVRMLGCSTIEGNRPWTEPWPR